MSLKFTQIVFIFIIIVSLFDGFLTKDFNNWLDQIIIIVVTIMGLVLIERIKQLERTK